MQVALVWAVEGPAYFFLYHIETYNGEASLVEGSKEAETIFRESEVLSTVVGES